MKSHLTTVVALLALGVAAEATAQERITVTTFSGAYADAQRECVIKPFSKATGIAVVPEPGPSGVTLAKLIQQKANPAVDVAWLGGGFSEQAWAEGVIDTIDPKALSNLAGMADQSVYKTKDGKTYALSSGYWSQGLLYNTKEIKQKPTSWFDMWKPEYANRVTFPSTPQTAFMPMIVLLNQVLGGSMSNFEPVMEKFRAFKVASYYASLGAALPAIQSGDVIMGVIDHSQTWVFDDQGVPVSFVIPKEGTPGVDNRVHLVKGTKNKAAAEKFLNYAITADALNCFGETLYLGPPLKAPKLSDKAKQRMPWGADGSIANLVIPDWEALNAKRAEVIEMWNRKVIAK